MKKIVVYIVPFLSLPIFTPLYAIADSLFLVDIFGCGCVPIAQTNMLNIPYNANHLRRTVYFILTVVMTMIAWRISKPMQQKWKRVVYCASALISNLIVTIVVCKAFMWA